MLRYVVLHHTGYGEDHFDLMFETGPESALVTFRLTEWPVKASTKRERLPDHRRAYLTYQGPVSNNRGQVNRVASGTCSISGNQAALDTGLVVHF